MGMGLPAGQQSVPGYGGAPLNMLSMLGMAGQAQGQAAAQQQGVPQYGVTGQQQPGSYMAQQQQQQQQPQMYAQVQQVQTQYPGSMQPQPQPLQTGGTYGTASYGQQLSTQQLLGLAMQQPQAQQQQQQQQPATSAQYMAGMMQQQPGVMPGGGQHQVGAMPQSYGLMAPYGLQAQLQQAQLQQQAPTQPQQAYGAPGGGTGASTWTYGSR